MLVVLSNKNDDYVIICPNISKKVFHKKIANSKVHLDTTSYRVVYEEKEENLNEIVD